MEQPETSIVNPDLELRVSRLERAALEQNVFDVVAAVRIWRGRNEIRNRHTGQSAGPVLHIRTTANYSLVGRPDVREQASAEPGGADLPTAALSLAIYGLYRDELRAQHSVRVRLDEGKLGGADGHSFDGERPALFSFVPAEALRHPGGNLRLPEQSIQLSHAMYSDEAVVVAQVDVTVRRHGVSV